MKKKFLALALAAAVMAPTTSAFASTTVSGSDKDVHTSDVTIEGTVRKADGTAPDGKIEVELPLKTAFTVDKDGKFTGSTFDITNKGGSSVKVTVAQFIEGSLDGGITIDKTLNITNANTKSRDTVRLYLEATQGANSEAFDLDRTVSNAELITIPSGDAASVALLGIAGTKKQDDSGADYAVETSGASENFTLRFKIQKA